MMQGLLQAHPTLVWGCSPPHFPVCRKLRQPTRRKRTEIRALNLLTQIAADVASDGPIELPPEIIQQDEQPLSPLRIVASFVLTGAIIILLIRSLRRRFKDAREVKKPLKEQAKKAILELKSLEVEVEKPPPSVVDTIIGALIGAGIAFVLFQITMAVDNNFASKPLPTDGPTRNIAVTVRTIIRGMCYLATCVYGGNSVGLLLYGVQLMTDPPPESKQEIQTMNETKSETESSSSEVKTD